MPCPSASLAVWSSAWLAGTAASDDVLDAMTAWSPAHDVVAVDAASADALDLPTPDHAGTGLAALLVSRHDPDATMAVMPSDHVIAPAAKFREAIEQAAALVAEAPGRLVTFGIKPTYPAESFGYIQQGAPLRVR